MSCKKILCIFSRIKLQIWAMFGSAIILYFRLIQLCEILTRWSRRKKMFKQLVFHISYCLILSSSLPKKMIELFPGMELDKLLWAFTPKLHQIYQPPWRWRRNRYTGTNICTLKQLKSYFIAASLLVSCRESWVKCFHFHCTGTVLLSHSLWKGWVCFML